MRQSRGFLLLRKGKPEVFKELGLHHRIGREKSHNFLGPRASQVLVNQEKGFCIVKVGMEKSSFPEYQARVEKADRSDRLLTERSACCSRETNSSSIVCSRSSHKSKGWTSMRQSQQGGFLVEAWSHTPYCSNAN